MEIQALKSLGQNFLSDQNIVKKIVRLSDLSKKDIVLEIGPGTGYLTKGLALNCKKVIAVEKDKRLISILKEKLKDHKNIEIINQDIKKYKIRLKDYKVVSNLPYNIANLIIKNLLENKNPPLKMVLIIQKEVAQRICQKPPRMNILAVTTQSLASPKILSYISKNSFFPRPKVDGAILELIPKKNNINFSIVKAGFSHPRKCLDNNLSKKLKLNKEKTQKWLMENNINPKQRAETLSLNDWYNLSISL